MWISGIFKTYKSERIEIDEFRKLFTEFFPPLIIYASHFVGDTDVAKDIVQEVFTRFWFESDKLRNKDLVKPYLYKSVKNRALNHIKSDPARTRLDEMLLKPNDQSSGKQEPDVSSWLDFEILKKDLSKAIEDLPDQQKKVFKMSRFQGMTHKEIAGELDISPKTVETHIYRALLVLKRKLKDHLS